MVTLPFLQFLAFISNILYLQYYQIDIQANNQESWQAFYRYSDFRKFYQNVKKLTANVLPDDFFYGLRCMLETGLVNRQLNGQRQDLVSSLERNNMLA
jgi:hypothetical protein